MLDPNTITKEYDQQAKCWEMYAREMLKFVGMQQAYLAQYMIPHSNIGGLNNNSAKAFMFGDAILSMHKTIKEVEKIGMVNIDEVVDSARLVCVATKEAYEQLTAESDSLDDDVPDKLEIKTVSAIVNTMLECSQSAFHATKAAICATRVVEAVRDAKRASP